MWLFNSFYETELKPKEIVPILPHREFTWRTIEENGGWEPAAQLEPEVMTREEKVAIIKQKRLAAQFEGPCVDSFSLASRLTVVLTGPHSTLCHRPLCHRPLHMLLPSLAHWSTAARSVARSLVRWHSQFLLLPCAHIAKQITSGALGYPLFVTPCSSSCPCQTALVVLWQNERRRKNHQRRNPTDVHLE